MTTTQQQQQWQTVCHLNDLIPHSGVAAKVNDAQLALYYLPESDRIFAIDNYCPFANANVLSRGIFGDLQGKLVIASPVYKQHFCLDTGKCLEDESVSINTYVTRIENNQVEVAL